MGNRRVVAQAIWNLLSNSIKFVAPGVKPQITIRPEMRQNGSAETVRVWFEDNGIGIPKDQIEPIFEVFHRVHDGDGYAGNGVGLAIVKHGIERMGGHVGVESTEGKGSRFWIEMQAAP